MVVRLSWLKKSRFIIVGILVCIVVLVHLEMQLALLVKTNEDDTKRLSFLEDKVDEVKRFNLRTEEIIKSRELSASKVQSQQQLEPISDHLLEESQDGLASTEKAVIVTNNYGGGEVNITDLQERLRLQLRVRNGVKELWWHLRARLRNLKQSGVNVDSILEDIGYQQKTVLADLDKIGYVTAVWKKRTVTELAQLVQKRFHHLQNPKDCKTARKLICDLSKPCGYGCQIHHIGYCFILAYATQRTMILQSHSWQYSSNKGWNSVFLPLSETCTGTTSAGERWSSNNDHVLEVKVPIVEMLSPRPPQMPMSFPRDLAEKLLAFHGYPFVWWAGQVFRYLLRPNKDLTDYINSKRKEIGFKRPIVGVHVRRTDKVGTEAAFHSIEEYMIHVDEWYQQLAITTGKPVDQKRVFLATDDAQLLAEAKRKYPDYQFASDRKISESAGTGTRYSVNSLYGVIFDIEMLSESDYIVCTFSSQVCRLAYELMQSHHVDASLYYYSLDDIYYYGGMQGHNVRAIYPHQPQTSNQLDLKVGDVIAIAGNEKDGTSKGRIQRTGKYGEYLSYKAEEIFRIEDFPSYKGIL